MEADAIKKASMMNMMNFLNIKDYEILKAFEGKNAIFTEDQRSIKYGDTIYEYGPYSGDFPFRKEYLSWKCIGCSISNKVAQNNQKEEYYTIIFEDDASFVGSPSSWEDYMNNLPAEDDYDIIFLSDCTWSNKPYSKGEYYNDYYSFLPLPYFDISGTHSYIVNPKILKILNSNFNFRLAADDYLNYCINTYKLKVLVSNEILFSQTPARQKYSTIFKKYKIVFYNRMWDGKFPDYSGIPIPEDFEVLNGQEYISEADVVIFHIPTLEIGIEVLKTIKKKKKQLWVFWSMECEAHYQSFYEQEIIKLFDIRATYKLDSDIPVTYFANISEMAWRRKPEIKKEFINAFISSTFDQSGRQRYLKELMSYLDVHSYGKLLNNKSLINDEGVKTKIEIISKYKFTLAFENAIAKDYVTEKFFHPLILGSVPVYLGAPNIDYFTPGENCFINVNSFSSIKELADYLIMLDKNDDLYREYFRWKELPFRYEFESKSFSIQEPPLIRLFDLVRRKFEISPNNKLVTN